MAGIDYRSGWYSYAPPWLRAGVAEKYLYTLELMRDLLAEKATEAVKIRLPGKGDPSQIPYLAHDRQLMQGPLEPEASFVARLTEAFATWAKAGSAPAVLGQLQAYAQGSQTGSGYEFAIVAAPRATVTPSQVTAWWTLRLNDPIGAEPLLSVVPRNFEWDLVDTQNPRTMRGWRVWLVLYQHAVATGQSGASAATSTAGGGSFTQPGELVDGVWEPRTTGTPVNAPFVTLTGLSGLTNANEGDAITISGSSHGTNNGAFQIVQVVTPTSCVIANVHGVAADAGPLAWSISRYPWIPPGPALGVPGQVWGQGADGAPPIDTGSNVGGIWQPTLLAGAGTAPSWSWGLRVSSLEIDTVRGLVAQWKSAGTYYQNIIVSYGAGEYDRLASPGAGNPGGDFASVGVLSNGVWVPTRQIFSPWTSYCQGTGRAVSCGVENIT